MKLFFLMLILWVTFSEEVEYFISAFNVRQYGQSKSKKPWVMSQLVKIFRRYDLLVMQEIQDSEETAIFILLEDLNEGLAVDERYQLNISTRVGRTDNKEQYGYFFKPSKFDIVGSYQYDDSAFDYFEREPFSAMFEVKRNGFQFFLIALHDKPTDAYAETVHLIQDVYESYLADSSIADVVRNRTILMGDLNMDCSYYSTTKKNNFQAIIDPYPLEIIIDKDSTVATSACSYDRFIIPSGNGTIQDYIRDIDVLDIISFLNTNQTYAELVSDHHPIELKLVFTINDEDGGDDDNTDNVDDGITFTGWDYFAVIFPLSFVFCLLLLGLITVIIVLALFVDTCNLAGKDSVKVGKETDLEAGLVDIE